MSQKRKAAERLVFDARGMPRWDQRLPSGEYKPRPKDSPALRELKADALSLVDTRRQRILQHPYGPNAGTDKPLKTRSKLDYMRALSQAIKTRRQAEGKTSSKDATSSKRIKRVLQKLRGR